MPLFVLRNATDPQGCFQHGDMSAYRCTPLCIAICTLNLEQVCAAQTSQRS